MIEVFEYVDLAEHRFLIPFDDLLRDHPVKTNRPSEKACGCKAFDLNDLTSKRLPSLCCQEEERSSMLLE